MTRTRQLSVFAACFLGTIVICYANSEAPPALEPELPPWSAPLIHSTLPQIEVPLGLLPHMELDAPGFGMEDGRIAWMAEQHFNDLGLAYTGPQPKFWPDVPKEKP